MIDEPDDIISYRDMCDLEKVQNLQRGMNFRMNPAYSVILMSQRSNAPYQDSVLSDGVTIVYEGHDATRRGYGHNPKLEDQPRELTSGGLTQNGHFIRAVEGYKRGESPPELVKVYEKVFPGVWSIKGYFDLFDYRVVNDGHRNVFRFELRLSERHETSESIERKFVEHSRIIPSAVKREVWKRDEGKCVLCGDSTNIHFDHELPFSKGGTSLSASNVRILCMRHNLQKSDKIE